MYTPGAFRPVFLNLFWFTAPFMTKNITPKWVNYYFEAPLVIIMAKFH